MEPLVIQSNSPAMSEDIRALACAFLLAKKEFLTTGKSGKNTQFGKYAKIEDIYNAVEQALSKNNIIIWHFARPEAGMEYLYTRLVHTVSGQFLEDIRMLESEKPGNQAKGAANTYMKKYALLSLCAIPTEDDDGHAEQKHIDEPTISPDQLISLQTEIKAARNGAKLHKDILGYNKVQDLTDLRVSSFQSVKSYIAKNKE